jgi:hypothetical protein
MTKWCREKTQINKIRDKNEDITQIPMNFRESLESTENLYSSRLENLDELDEFLDTYNQSKLNQEAISHLNSPITYDKTETVIKSLFTKRAHDLTDSWPNFSKPLTKN